MPIYIFLSIGLHSILLLLLYQEKFSADILPKTTSSSIEWIELPAGQDHTVSKGQNGNKDGTLLKRLLHGGIQQTLDITEASEGRNYEIDQDFGGSGELLQDAVELPPALEKIWRHIRYHAVYHTELLLEGVQGRVHAKIKINKYGRLEKIFFITGQSKLSHWVKVAIYNALKENVLRNPMPRPMHLELLFKYYLTGSQLPIQEYVFNYNQFDFDIPGYVGSPTQRVWQFKNLFIPYEAKAKSEWSLNKKIETYRKACQRQSNQIACRNLQKLDGAL